MASTGIDAYRTVRTTTADPITLTTMLFDGAVKAMKKARLLHERGDRQGFVRECELAMNIVGELLCSLDLTQGEIPQTLKALYSYCLCCLVEATLGDMEKLDEAQRHVAQIGAAWKQATASLRQGKGSAGAVAGAAA